MRSDPLREAVFAGLKRRRFGYGVAMIVNCIRRWARSQPTRLAIVHNGCAIDYATFWRALVLVRRRLEREKVAPGTTAIVMVEDLLLCWLTVLAWRWLGLNTVSVATADAIVRLGILDAGCIAIAQYECRPHQERLLAGLGLKLVRLSPIDPADIAAVDATDRPAVSRNYGGHLLYTSGTTGSYKKLLLDAAREGARNEIRARAMGFSQATVFHCLNFGLWTGAGYKQPLAAWHRGACVVFDQRPGMFDRFFDSGITKASLLPPMCKELLNACASGGAVPAYPELELNLMSGFLSMAMAQQIVHRITPKLFITYSATELVGVPMQSQFRHREDLDWLSVTDGATVEIVDEYDLPCANEAEGHIRIRLIGADCRAYLDSPEATAASFRNSCFYPGDMGVRRKDGKIRVLGRVADIINLHGAKVAVAPFEQDLQRKLAVDDVCLYAHLNAAGQEEVLVAVEARRQLERHQTDFIRNRFADFDSVKIRVFEEFPRTEAGTRKIRRAVLKKWFEDPV